MTRKSALFLLVASALALVGCSNRPVVIALPAPTQSAQAQAQAAPATQTLSPGAQFIAMMAAEGVPVSSPDRLVQIAQSACAALHAGHSLTEVTTSALSGITDSRVQIQVLDVITGGQVVYCPDTM